jgi:hypothetical protein
LNKLAPIGLAAAAVVIAALVVGCGAPSSTVGEPFADSGSTPQSSVAAPPRAARSLLRRFLAARVAGKGAQRYLSVPEKDIPLLYATTSGTPYERAEFNRVRGIEWPYGLTAFRVRLSAGGTMVEQLFFFRSGSPRLVYQSDGFGAHIAPTTENGRPVAVRYSLAVGAVTVQVAHPWISWAGGSRGDLLGARLIPQWPIVRPTTDGGERIHWDELLVMADPTLFGGCRTGPSPADAEALAESIRSDHDLGATAPMAVSVGGTRALMLDVVTAAGTSLPYCEGRPFGLLSPLVDHSVTSPDGKGGVIGRASGERMRLYLFDAPKRSSIRVLAMAIAAPKSGFKSVVKAAAPVVDSVEFR